MDLKHSIIKGLHCISSKPNVNNSAGKEKKTFFTFLCDWFAIFVVAKGNKIDVSMILIMPLKTFC